MTEAMFLCPSIKTEIEEALIRKADLSITMAIS